MKTKFINSVCFARRGYSSPLRTNNYLYSFMEQIKLNNKYGVPGTYLLQYDTLIDPIYRDILAKNCKDGDEIGLGGLNINGNRQDDAAYFTVRIGTCI